jgi:uncharacterized membrane protein YdjX (TVP38/TMEM64 family)
MTFFKNVKKEWLVNGLWVLVILGAIFAFTRFFSIDNLQERVLDLGLWGPFLLIIMKASTLVFAPLGGSPLYPITGAIYGFGMGFIFMVVGDIIGNSICFFISRHFGRKIVTNFVSEFGMKAVDYIIDYLGTWRGLLQARIFFMAFPEAVSYATGFTKIPYLQFILIQTIVGLIPTAILVWLGDAVVAYSENIYIVLGISLFFVALTGIGSLWFVKMAKKHGLEKDNIRTITEGN